MILRWLCEDGKWYNKQAPKVSHSLQSMLCIDMACVVGVYFYYCGFISDALLFAVRLLMCLGMPWSGPRPRKKKEYEDVWRKIERNLALSKWIRSASSRGFTSALVRNPPSADSFLLSLKDACLSISSRNTRQPAAALIGSTGSREQYRQVDNLQSQFASATHSRSAWWRWRLAGNYCRRNCPIHVDHCRRR